MKIEDITNTTSEAGIISTIIQHPEYVFLSENLQGSHFSDLQNRIVYEAVKMLAQKDVRTVDAYNIVTALESTEATKFLTREISTAELNELIEMSPSLARHTPEEYRLCVDNVMDCALRRDLLRQLKRCEGVCLNTAERDIEQQIYSAIDDVMVEFSNNHGDVPPFADVIDNCWEEIKGRQGAGCAGIPFKFPALNEYASIERGELFIFGAEQKQGKSMMLLNCAVDLLQHDYGVLYLDSELNTRLFTARILAHLSGVTYRCLTTGNYSKEEEERIIAAKEWLKTRDFTHIYIPMFDLQSIYTAVKKVRHTQKLDVLIVDYFKGRGEGDAFDSYQELGRFTDMVKNQIAGDMNIAAIGAAQATAGGKLADSAKISRNASTIAMLSDKTPEEIERDGAECGNKKLFIRFNRNGAQMADGEYIDMRFDGNHVLYEQAEKQHIPQDPF